MPTEELIKQTSLLRRACESSQILVRKSEDGKETFRFPASSETPVERWFGMEVLSHESSAIRLGRATSGAMPLLFNHDIDDCIGMIEGASIQGGRLMVDAKLFDTARGAEVRKMMAGGLRNVSLAYRINVIEEEKQSETFRVTDWEPYEVSIVTVPADPTVGIGRGVETEYEVRMVRASQPAQRAKEAVMAEEGKDPVAVVTADPPVVKPNAVEFEKSRKRAIENLCKANSLDEKYRDHWVGTGQDLESISNDILGILEERGKTNPQPLSKIGMSETDVKRFSLTRAIRACSEKDWTHAPHELEASRAVAQKLGKVVDPRKFYVPFEVLERPVQPRGQRDLSAGTVGAGGYLVGTENVGFIEMLRNRSVAFRMGARRLSGLSGNVTVPRQSAAATGYWLANETTQITESQQTFVQVSLTPKTVGAYTEISRLLLLQSNPSAEGIVTDDLVQVVATAADLAVLNGSGSAGQPTGIIGTSGIGGVTGTSIDYAKVLEFQTDIATSNVVPMAGGYVTTPAVAALLMQRQRFSSTDTPLWAGNIWNGQISGFPAMSSNQMPAADMLFGDWQEVVVGEWGVLEVEVNPYANFQAGIIGVRAMYSLDVAVRRPFAFSLATSIT
jgi:HK97 family phage major capsid protein/HK97 family phage prohead protease